VNARDEEGRTALMKASQYDHVDVVELLLERGAEKEQGL
jgi:ankyrin repeat protein